MCFVKYDITQSPMPTINQQMTALVIRCHTPERTREQKQQRAKCPDAPVKKRGPRIEREHLSLD